MKHTENQTILMLITAVYYCPTNLKKIEKADEYDAQIRSRRGKK